MKISKAFLYLFLIVLLIGCGEKAKEMIEEEVAPAHEYGKIITAEEADQEFGPVFISKEINTEELRQLLTQSTGSVMFHLKESLMIADQKRKAIFPADAKVADNDTFVVYYTAKVDELLNTGGEEVTTIEKRESKVTISNGNNVLEYGTWCPPYCAPAPDK